MGFLLAFDQPKVGAELTMKRLGIVPGQQV